MRIEKTDIYPPPFFDPISPCFHGEKGLREFGLWWLFGPYFCSWGCQNKQDGLKEWENIVERRTDGLYILRMVGFCLLLGFQLDTMLQMLMHWALNIQISGEKCKVLCVKELSYGVLVQIEIREDLFVSVGTLGLTLADLVVVEIQGETPPHKEIWWRSQWGEWCRVQESGGVVL